MRRLRILHIATRLLPSGGAGRNVNLWISVERALGHQVDLLIGESGSVFGGQYPEVPTWRLAALRRKVAPVDDMRAAWALRRFIAQGDYDVVHTHLSKAGIIGRFAARGSASTILHTVHMASFGPGYGRLTSGLYRQLEIHAAGCTTVLIAVGEELRGDYLAAGIGSPERFKVIRSPVELERFLAGRLATERERLESRQRVGVGSPAHLLVGAGLLEPRKRYDLLLRMVAPWLREGGTYLVIAGDGPERGNLVALANRLGIDAWIRLPGHVSDLPALFAAADLFVHTSSAEGVPQVVIQALATGLPVVATKVEGLREVASAPIAIRPRSGAGFLEACRSMLAGGTHAPLPASALMSWGEPVIRREIELLYAQLARRHDDLTA